MLIVFGTAGLIGAILLFGVTLIGGRNPRPPAWADDFLVANIYVPAMIGLAALGAGSIAKAIIGIGSQPLRFQELVLAVGIAVVGLFLLKLLRVRQRLAVFATLSASDRQPSCVQRFPVDANDRDSSGTPTDQAPDNLAA